MIHLDPTFSDLLMFILLDIKVRRPPSMLLPYRQGGVPFIVLRVVRTANIPSTRHFLS